MAPARIFGVPGHDQRDFEFAKQISVCRSGASSLPSPAMASEPIGRRGRNRRRHRGQFAVSRRPDDRAGDAPKSSAAPRRPAGARARPSTACATGACRASAIGARRSRSSIARAAAPVPVPRDQLAGRAARGRQLRHARQSARPPSDLEQGRLPEMRRRRRGARPTRSTPSSISSWYFIRFASQPADKPFDRAEAEAVAAGRPIYRRRRACDPAPALRPLLDPGAAADRQDRRWPSRSRACSRKAWSRTRPTAPATAAGSARTRSQATATTGCTSKAAQPVSARPRREDVQVEENTVDPEPILDAIRRRRGALVHAVRQPARARPRMVRRRDRGRGALRPARLAAGDERPAGDGRRRRAANASCTAPSPRSAKRSRGCSSTRRSPQLYELTSAIEKAKPSATRDEAIRTLGPAGRAGGAAPGRGSLGRAAASRA